MGSSSAESGAKPEPIQGRRRPDGTQPYELEAGDYALHASGDAPGWWICDPAGSIGRLATPGAVTVHEDETITVDGEIRQRSRDCREWRGFLERGVWREA